MTCKKVYFRDEQYALEYISKLKKTSCRERKPVRAYLCEKCLNWHLTSIETKDTMEVVYLRREITNLKAKIQLLKEENETLKTISLTSPKW
jgi:hypothetical protein